MEFDGENGQFPAIFMQFKDFYEEQRKELLENFENQRIEMYENYATILQK